MIFLDLLKELILRISVAEQVRHGLLVVYATHGLGEEQRYVDRLDLVALDLLHLVRHRVRHDHFVDARVVDETWRVRREQTVCGHHVYLVRATLLEHFGSTRKRVDIIYHILLFYFVVVHFNLVYFCQHFFRLSPSLYLPQ